MSGFQSSAPLTGALLASKGAASPSRSVSSLLNNFAEEELAATHPTVRQASVESREPAGKPVEFAPRPRKAAAAAGSGTKTKPLPDRARIKLSLRLTEDEHLRLKLAAAHLRESAQTILMAALDDYLARKAPEIRAGECVCLMSAVDGHRSAMPAHGEPHGNAD